MTNQELEDAIKESVKDSDCLKVLSVGTINYRPHQYTVGPRHIEYASKHSSGMLGKDTCEVVPCAHPGCNEPYSAHKFDTVAFIQLKRNSTNAEIKIEMLKMKAVADESFDGFVFVDTKESFRIHD